MGCRNGASLGYFAIFLCVCALNREKVNICFSYLLYNSIKDVWAEATGLLLKSATDQMTRRIYCTVYENSVTSLFAARRPVCLQQPQPNKHCDRHQILETDAELSNKKILFGERKGCFFSTVVIVVRKLFSWPEFYIYILIFNANEHHALKLFSVLFIFPFFWTYRIVFPPHIVHTAWIQMCANHDVRLMISTQSHTHSLRTVWSLREGLCCGFVLVKTFLAWCWSWRPPVC